MGTLLINRWPLLIWTFIPPLSCESTPATMVDQRSQTCGWKTRCMCNYDGASVRVDIYFIINHLLCLCDTCLCLLPVIITKGWKWDAASPWIQVAVSCFHSSSCHVLFLAMKQSKKKTLQLDGGYIVIFILNFLVQFCLNRDFWMGSCGHR